jgi:hypothetical protein
LTLYIFTTWAMLYVVDLHRLYLVEWWLLNVHQQLYITRTSRTIKKKTIQKWQRYVTIGAMTLGIEEEFSLVTSAKRMLLFELKIDISFAGDMLSKHVIHYGHMSGFLITTTRVVTQQSLIESAALSATRGRSGQLCVLGPGKRHRHQANMHIFHLVKFVEAKREAKSIPTTRIYDRSLS